MPGRGRPKGKSKSNIGRNDRNSRNRRTETSEEHDARLESNRVRTRQARANETHEQRVARLETNRIQTSQARSNETEEQTAARLETDRVQTSQARANESSEQYAARLESNRMQTSQARANETEEQTAARLETDRVQTSQARAEENEEQTEARLADQRARMAVVRAAQRVSDFEARSGVLPSAFTLGLRDKECPYGCKALMFESELRVSKCCRNGTIVLEESQCLSPYPEDLKLLLIGQHPSSRNFFKYIRRYNNAFSFVSLGAQSVTPPGNGPYVFKIHGNIYHRSGLLHPAPNEAPRFGQIYILEGDGALDARLNNNTDCLRDVMALVQLTLDACNPYTAAYKHLHRVEKDELSLAAQEGRDPHSIRMVFSSGPDRRRYNAPTNDDVAVVFDDSVPGRQELCVYPKASDALCKIEGRRYMLHSRDCFKEPVRNMTTADLHALTPEGFPVHDLCLKVGCTVRLLKRLNMYPDMNVGDRLTVEEVGDYTIKCKFNNQSVTIGRLNFTSLHHDNEFIRNQFPLKLDRRLDILRPIDKNVDPMVYPLFFPHGEKGWHEHMRKHNKPNAKHCRITQLQFYAYRLAYRTEPFSPLHYGQKLFQQYIVDSWVRIESNRLNYIRTNQNKIRADKYINLIDHFENINAGNVDPDAPPPGKLIVLPATHVSGPRYMKQGYEDSMAIVTKFGRPCLFVTFTCNPKHPDIQRNLGNRDGWHKLTASDRPDVVAVVFKLHLDELKKDLRTKLGVQLANIHVIEYQKRGLPHAHILVWLDNDSKLRTPEDIDSLICAEIPDPDLDPELYFTVTTMMMHGPCGLENPNAPCMVDGKCSKQFPKQFQEETQVNIDGYPLYRRRDNGRTVDKGNVRLDNRHVVPYCPWLSKKYGAHINVEACTSIKALKYLFKYVYKGHDCANIERSEQDPQTHDEIKSYQDHRYVSPPEAMARIYEYPVADKSHTIVRLDVHLEHGHNVTFGEGEDIENVLERADRTKLTEYFDLNERDPAARQYLYSEIPEHYTWQATGKRWKPRARGANNIIARMYGVSPRDRERFFLRMLLLHVRGARSFRDLRTFEGAPCATYEEACRERGLLVDDAEWHRTLEEANITASPKQLRELFVTILGSCEPSDPIDLWEHFKSYMSEDFLFHHDLSPDMAAQYALHEINSSLLHNYGRRVTDFHLSLVDDLPDLDSGSNSIDPEVESAEYSRLRAQCNDEQGNIVDTVVHEIDAHGASICTNRPRVFFIDAPGGCGKTFVANTLISYALGKSLKVASCAWTGIAGNLLRFGMTVHCLFKLPLNIDDRTSSSITTTSNQAAFLNSLSLIFVDEASMIPLHALRAIDVVLGDITSNRGTPFGGKLIVFAGDFRQTLPIIPRAGPALILENCINRSPLWQHFRQFQLTQNMRANPDENAFCSWLIELGDGNVHSSHPNTDAEQFDIPDSCILTASIVDSIYPDFTAERSNSIILSPKNVDTHEINRDVLAKFNPEVESRTYFSTDRMVEDEGNDVNSVSPEFLHTLIPSGMPLHELELKVGCPVMLLRNLDTKNGLCNGTRLTVIALGNRCIEAKIISGSSTFVGRHVFIPRIKLIPSDTSVPFKFQRTQFPIRLAYCMTINKSQGQTFDKVGIYLPRPCFSHGQVYVAFSRARCFGDITLQIKNTARQFVTDTLDQAITVNVVFNVHGR